MIECPSCARRQQPQLICEQCGSPLGAETDLFAALGLPKKLVIDSAALERTYHDLSRRIHPDRFASQNARVRSASMRSTALLTRANRTLRDPVSRGLYWLELHGEKLGTNNNQVPPDLAELVFDVQEQLADLDSDKSDAAQNAVATRRDEIELMIATALDELDKNFARWDSSQPDAAKPLTAELKAILSKIAYLRTLIRDVDRALENAKAA
ncbi:MAG TPA: Fe-S protein assembly co-chaperone HscB [Candidatus Binataceae bacterium]|nr:Fe-S protein assembly co-chaperone HscB [Candidatus Binataceae bacterium]